MTTDEQNTPEPVVTTSSQLKRDYAEQVAAAENEDYGFVDPEESGD